MFIGVGTSEKVEGPDIGGGTIQDNGKCLEMLPRQDKILLSGVGGMFGEETISASSKQVYRITVSNSFI